MTADALADPVPDHPAWQELARAARAPETTLSAMGRPLLGLGCGRLPTELPAALGLHAWRILPGSVSSSRADGLMEGFSCSWLQQLLHLGLGDELRPLAGLTLPANTCDSMRSFPALWRASAARPPRLFSLRLPARLGGSAAAELLEAELQRWLAWLEALAGQRLQPERLQQAARLANRQRAALRRLQALARDGGLPYQLAALAGRGAQALPGEQAAPLLEAAAAAAPAAAARSDGGRGPRLALVGGLLEAGPLLEWLRRHGARVVEDETCALGRWLDEEYDLDLERPLPDLSQRLLRCQPCPTAAGSAARRVQALQRRVASRSVQGVLLLRLRGCEAHAFDGVLLGQALQERGLPHLHLELEPGQPITGQQNTRLEAFLELLPGEGS